MSLLASSLTPNASAANTPRHSGASSPNPEAFAAGRYNARLGSGTDSTSGLTGSNGSPALGGYFTPAEGSSLPPTPHHLGAAWDGSAGGKPAWS
jgi:hypothetical protein